MNSPNEQPDLDSLGDLFLRAPRLQASSALWQRIEADLLPGFAESRQRPQPWSESLLSMVATLVLLALPWAVAHWSFKNVSIPGSAVTRAQAMNPGSQPQAAHRVASAQPPTLAQEWTGQTEEQSERALDEDTLNWLASLGEVAEEESYESPNQTLTGDFP